MRVLRLGLACLLALTVLPLQASQGKKYPKLMLALLKKTPDKEVEGRIFLTTLARTQTQNDFTKLPQGMRMVFSTMQLENEINKGGFHQYFRNSGAEFAKEALMGLHMIGAENSATLVKTALNIRRLESAESRNAGVVRESAWDRFLKSTRPVKLRALEQEFYKQTDNLSKLRIKYIRAHPEKFVEK